MSKGTLPDVCSSDYTDHRTPLIIPPSFLKPDLPSVLLKAAWSSGAKALSGAKFVVFVGYSFPTSDTEMMYFLGSALSKNADLNGIYIVDPNASDIEERLCAEGSGCGHYFKTLLHSVPVRWEDTNLDRIINN
jgi:hypothetical protein